MVVEANAAKASDHDSLQSAELRCRSLEEQLHGMQLALKEEKEEGKRRLVALREGVKEAKEKDLVALRKEIAEVEERGRQALEEAKERFARELEDERGSWEEELEAMAQQHEQEKVELNVEMVVDDGKRGQTRNPGKARDCGSTRELFHPHHSSRPVSL